MPGYLGKHTNSPQDTTAQVAQAERDTTWGNIPGEVLSYDAAKGTATVRPLYKPVVNGKKLDMPDLYEVPIDQPRTAGMGITFPIPAGTKVLLSPQMRAMDDYEEGSGGTAYDARSFHLSNMRATISGGDSLSNPLANVDPSNFHLRFSVDGSFGLKGSPDGKLQLTGSQGDVIDILAEFMELVASDELLIKHGSSSGSGHQLQNKSALIELAAKMRGMVL
jgi:hypothetical protein